MAELVTRTTQSKNWAKLGAFVVKTKPIQMLNMVTHTFFIAPFACHVVKAWILGSDSAGVGGDFGRVRIVPSGTVDAGGTKVPFTPDYDGTDNTPEEITINSTYANTEMAQGDRLVMEQVGSAATSTNWVTVCVLVAPIKGKQYKHKAGNT